MSPFEGVFGHDGAIEAGERALTIATDLGDLDLQVMARYVLGVVSHEHGDCVRARDLLRWVVDALDPEVASETDPRLGHGPEGRERGEAPEGRRPTWASFEAQAQRMGLWSPTSILVRSRVWLAASLGQLGQFVEGISVAERAIRIAESGDDHYDRIMAGTSLGIAYHSKGDLDRAIPLLERSVALARTWGIVSWVALTKGCLGASYARVGRYNEAFRLLQEALETDRRMTGGHVNSLRARQLGEIYLLAGRFAEASEHARQALELSIRRGRYTKASALQLLGEVASHRDQFQSAEAEEYYRQALALAEELELRPRVAHCHAGLAKLYRRTGKRQEAQEHLTTATSMYREMGMTYWLDKAEAETRELM